MSNRLPETEIANWSFLPVEQKRDALISYDRPKKIPGSYEPFRRVFPDAINQQYPLFADKLRASDWEAIEHRLTGACQGNAKLISMNKGILKATHQYALENRLSSTPVDVVPIRFPGGISYQFGLPTLMRYRDRASFAFLDLRRSTGLNPNGRKFVFSLMHERFRSAYADFAEADLEIWRYRSEKDGSRTLIPQRNERPQYSFDELAADVAETYQIYDWVRRGGDGKKRAGGGSAGPLFE